MFESKSQIIANNLRKLKPSPDLELITAKSGDWTLKKISPNGSYRFLHSRVDPKGEAKMWTEKQGVIMPCLVIIGIGLAYHVFELLKKRNNLEMAYLIEPDEGVFQMAMKVHDFSSLIRNPSVHFIIGAPPLAVDAMISTSLVQLFSCHTYFPIVAGDPDVYGPLRKAVERHLCALRLKDGADSASLQGDSLSFTIGVQILLNQMIAS